MIKTEIIVTKEDRVLNYISAECKNISYNAAAKALRQKDVKINGKRIKENISVYPDDKIEIFLNDKSEEPVFYDITYQDNNILIVNKKKGIETEGEQSLFEILTKENNNLSACHRLDRNTEGLVIFAKNQESLNQITKALAEGEAIEKFYIAEVAGSPQKNYDKVTAYLLKDSDESKVKIFSSPVKGAIKIVTEYWVLKKSVNTATLEVKLSKGKTHQIRAHLAYLKMPVIGDGKYGKNEDNKKFKAKSQLLCAHKLKFNFKPESHLSYLNDLDFQIKPSWIK